MNSIKCTTDQTEAFTDIDIAVLVGAFPRKPGMERKDMLAKNAEIFQAQGKLLDTVAKKTVKVLVVGNPANTNALIASTCAPSIPKENFSALTRLDQNRATAQIANKAGVAADKVKVSHRLLSNTGLPIELKKPDKARLGTGTQLESICHLVQTFYEILDIWGLILCCLECVHLGQPLGDAISGRVEWHRGEGRQVHHRRPRSQQ